MISEVDDALRSLVLAEAISADVDVVFDAPTKDWAARRNAPTVNLYLYDIREDLRRRERGWTDIRGEGGVVVSRRPVPRHFKLSYLVTAWTQRPEDEHRLLSGLLRCFLRHDAMPKDLVIGPLAETGMDVPITVALPPPEDRAFADVWSALGGELKPSLDVVVIAPIDTGVVFPAGPPVREGTRIDLSDVNSGAADEDHYRHSPHGARARPTARGGGRAGRTHDDATEHATAERVPARGRALQRTRETMSDNPSLADLLARVGDVEERIRALVAARRATDPQPDDPFRGLYLSEEAVDRLLDAESDVALRCVPARADGDASEPRDAALTVAGTGSPGAPTLRLPALARTCGLSALDVELLLVALSCDLDARFEQLFGYLNDDVTRRRPSAGVALGLCGLPLSSAAGRERLTSGPLVRAGLLVVDDPDRPFPGRALRVPDRVVAHLVGGDTLDPLLTGIALAPPDVAWGDGSAVADALGEDVRLCYLREPPTGSGVLVALDALAPRGARHARRRPRGAGPAGRPARHGAGGGP